jgi:hypothetical protein
MITLEISRAGLLLLKVFNALNISAKLSSIFSLTPINYSIIGAFHQSYLLDSRCSFIKNDIQQSGAKVKEWSCHFGSFSCSTNEQDNKICS